MENFRFNPPSFPYAVLSEFLATSFGANGAMKPLAGERDQNVRITTETGREYVFKIAGPDESFDLVDFQIKALEHVRQFDPSIPVPHHIRTLSGQLSTVITDEAGVPYHVRLLTFLPGVPMDTVEPPTDKQIVEIGSLTGRLCLALQDFKHTAATHFMPWDAMNGLVVFDSFKARYTPPDLVDDFAPHLERLKDISLPLMAALPTQVVHNDAHLGNLLSDPAKPDNVVGLIDFGDIIERPLVIDLSSTIASIIETNANVVGCCRLLLEGFERHVSAPDNQLELLYDAVFARLALSVQLFQFRQINVSRDEEIESFYLPRVIQALQTLLATERTRFTSDIMHGR